MFPEHISKHVWKAGGAMAPVFEFMGKYGAWAAAGGEDSCDFAVGNPHEMPLPGFVKALEKALPPQNKDWYAYTVNEPLATETIARALGQQFERPFDPADVLITNGATGAIQVVLNTVLSHDDEAIFLSPPWFFY